MMTRDADGGTRELRLSADDQPMAAGCVTAEIVDNMRREMHSVQNAPEPVFFHSFAQARAVVYGTT
jgi:hypothetical protein